MASIGHPVVLGMRDTGGKVFRVHASKKSLSDLEYGSVWIDEQCLTREDPPRFGWQIPNDEGAGRGNRRPYALHTRNREADFRGKSHSHQSRRVWRGNANCRYSQARTMNQHWRPYSYLT